MTPTEIKSDPVVAWKLTVQAGKTVEVTYHVPVAAGVTTDMVEQWKAEQLTDAAAFKVERTTPPTLSVSTTELSTTEGDVTGNVGPNASVMVNGVPAVVNADGTWTVHLGFVPGANPLNVVAMNDTFGTLNTLSWNINVVLPPTGTVPKSPGTATTVPKKTTTTTPTVPSGGGGPAATTTSSPTVVVPPPTTTSPPVVTAAPTTTSAAPAPKPTVKLSAPTPVIACRQFSVTATVTGATGGKWTDTLGTSKTTTDNRLTYTVGVPDSAAPYSFVVTYTVVNADGVSGSGSATITVNPDPTTPDLDC